MKKTIVILLILFVSSLSWNCEPDPVDGFKTIVKQPMPVPVPHNPIVNPPVATSYPWRMVVKNVDGYEGGVYNENFQDILLGNTLSNGIATTNTTFFSIDPQSNKVELKLLHMGWTLWEAYGFYPIVWEFEYEKSTDSLELEGFANMGLSICEMPEGSNLVNRFYFSGKADKTTEEKYVGRYVWSETYETGTCVKIEGEMEVLRSSNSYPVY